MRILYDVAEREVCALEFVSHAPLAVLSPKPEPENQNEETFAGSVEARAARQRIESVELALSMAHLADRSCKVFHRCGLRACAARSKGIE